MHIQLLKYRPNRWVQLKWYYLRDSFHGPLYNSDPVLTIFSPSRMQGSLTDCVEGSKSRAVCKTHTDDGAGYEIYNQLIVRDVVDVHVYANHSPQLPVVLNAVGPFKLNQSCGTPQWS